MSIRVILHGKVKDAAAWRDLSARATAAAKDEPGTTGYRWYLGDDGTFVSEDVYADEAAFFAHIGAMTESGRMDEFMAGMDLAGVLVLDPVNDEMKEAAKAFNAVHLAMIDGF